MTTFDAAQARAAADEITRRIHNDEDLAKRVRSNPAETLIEFGVPADVADRVVSTVGAPSEDDAPEHDPVLQAFTSLADYLSATGDRSKQKQWLPSNFKN